LNILRQFSVTVSVVWDFPIETESYVLGSIQGYSLKSLSCILEFFCLVLFAYFAMEVSADSDLRYDTIYYLHWKTDRQAASL